MPKPALAPAPRSNLVLIGARGCGKSTVGSILAGLLGRELIDTDSEIERETGMSVRDIFERCGEDEFRLIESRVLARALAGERRIVSVGGGAVLREENRVLMASRARCVWLTAEPEELLRRLLADGRSATLRPPLTALPPEQEIAAILAARGPLYAAIADKVLDTTRRAALEAADEIAAWWRQASDEGGAC